MKPKCPSCKYRNRTVSKTVPKITRYKSGKRKNEIKHIGTEKIIFYENDPEFIELQNKIGDLFRIREDDYTFGAQYDTAMMGTEPTILVCPKCGTIFVKEINEFYS